MSGSGRGPSRRSERCFESRETFPHVREWSKGPSGFSKVVEKTSQIFGSGREALLDVWEWLENPLGCPGVVRKHS